MHGETLKLKYPYLLLNKRYEVRKGIAKNALGGQSKLIEHQLRT